MPSEPAFNIDYHRFVASQIRSGRATSGMTEGSHEQLLAEVERLTHLVSPAKRNLPASTEPVEVSTLLGLIAVLAKQRRDADIQVEYMGMKSSPGYMGSYRGMYDQLAIAPDGREPQDGAGGYPAAMPEWVRGLARVVRADLEANRPSLDTGAEDFWGYSLHRYWSVEGAAPVSDWRGRSFVPADLDISWNFYPGRPESDHRYNVYAHSAGYGDRGRERDTGQWGGTAARHDRDLPGWIRELVDAQYEELAATGRASTAERDAA